MALNTPFIGEMLSPNDRSRDTAAHLLPASIRSLQHGLVRPTDDTESFLQKDLCVDKLNKIDQYLWLAGRPMPPRPLNYQIATSREIVVDERIDMHLVWEYSRRLHLKPIPRYLLSPKFWESHLLTCMKSCCVPQRSQHYPDVSVPISTTKCTKELYKCACGFLLSYLALIQFECDLAIAHTYHLLPKEITWEKWLTFAHELLEGEAPKPNNINSRYLFGELRLSQLNKIYALRYGEILRGYQFTYQTYGELFRDYLTPITAATIYMALVLTAMQVGLATTYLEGNPSFQNASSGFTIFSILGPLVGIFLVGTIGVFQFFNNLLETREFKQKRFGQFAKGMM
ncbi:hypothetical protein N7462_004211 [Penicillium macrosclerotiorum]|uniref:uncharacterized protein n=1 Tax=Penicillium macrosclerotiorum TaxID=303699 RepID=UPI0025497024|nr:uncharacterized protein N7462_004211 [Penicillium macrosclerotiorum]KAJ5689819.1 hypothetical protein N7462_004211 [Penicillium macrosclerotiorum]